MDLYIFDYSNSEVKIVNNCPSDWQVNIENVENYMFGEDKLDLNPNTCYYMFGDGIKVNVQACSMQDGLPSKIDFYAYKSNLKNCILEAIKDIMKKGNVTEIDLTQDVMGNEVSYEGYLIRSYDTVEEVLITSLKLDGDTLYYKAKGEGYQDDDWQNLRDDVVGDNCEMLYDAVYDKIYEMIEKSEH